MPGTLTPAQLAAVRMSAQGLGHRHRTVLAATRGCAGIQAQDLRAARLGVRARASGVRETDVRTAAEDPPSTVSTWVMRGTLHSVPAVDVRWMVALFGPPTRQRDRRRRESLGLTQTICDAVLAELPAVLQGGPLTRAQLVAALVERGVPVPDRGQAPAHAVLYAAASGLICRGPSTEPDEPTYVLLDDWVGAQARAPHADDLERLAAWYLDAAGPAEPADFTSWSGLPAKATRRAIEAAAVGSVTVEGRSLLVGAAAGVGAAGRVDTEVVRLLPAFDTALLTHRNRAALGDPAMLRRVLAGGWIHPSVLSAGRVLGRWRLQRVRGEVVVAVERSTGLTEEQLAEEAADIGRFLQTTSRLELVADLG